MRSMVGRGAIVVACVVLVAVLGARPGGAGSVGQDPEPSAGAVDGQAEPAAEADDQAGAEVGLEVLGGFLDWGMKDTFRTYVTGPIARGSITTSGGASVNADGTFRFPAASGGRYDHVARTASVGFQGAVHLRGHGYHDPSAGDLMQLSLSELRLELDGDQGELVADVTSLALEGGVGSPQPGGEPQHFDDVVLVHLDLAGTGPVRDGEHGLHWHDVPTTLSNEAAPAFESFYPAGTPFDPASFVLEVAEVPADVPAPPPPAPAPSASLDKTVVRAGETLTVRGTGFQAGEQVEVWLLPDPGWVSTAVADGAGAVVHTFVVPVTTAAGPHEVELRGISSGLTLRSPAVEVLPAEPALGAAGAAPPPAAAGTLPATGSEELVLALVGAGLVAVGAGLVLVERRARARQAGAP